MIGHKSSRPACVGVTFLLNFLCFCLPIFVSSQCSNKCAGHGICNSSAQCECHEGFRGGDCSKRICPSGASFSDPAHSENKAHQHEECSGRGSCNEEIGSCECMPGFTGIACERTMCSNNCNGKGMCVSYRQMALTTSNSNSQRIRYDNVWDADKIYGCLCDEGYSGYDCSIMSCPLGDDPLTPGGEQEKQLLYCNATEGAFVLYFDSQQSQTVDFSATLIEAKHAIESIPMLNHVTVEFSHGNQICNNETKNIVSITFKEQFGPLPPLVPVTIGLNDNAAVEIGSDNSNGMMVDDFGMIYLAIKGSKENAECSNRGVCDEGTGTCRCFDTNGDIYAGSDGYGKSGSRGDCGFAGATTSDCPGEPICSGNGICNRETMTCVCEESFSGGDCSLRVCPNGWSWFSYPSETDKGHDEWTACSDMGICDRITGNCKCNEGFFGSACEYMACGSGEIDPCSNNGRCLSMRSLAYLYNNEGVLSSQHYGTDPNNALTWDADRIFGCYCDEGYEGYDCSLKKCPSDSNGKMCSNNGLCDRNTGKCACFRGWGSERGAGSLGDCSKRRQ